MNEKNFRTLIAALEDSRSIGTEAGWVQKKFEIPNSNLTTFIKSHSYGEYIFDWGWAEAYERYGIPYYPKLTSMIPFTPVTTPHFFGSGDALSEHDKFLQDQPLSGAHFLFLPSEEKEIFQQHNYLLRDSIQYHFFNEGYEDFEEFLLALKSRKAKTLRKERYFSDLNIKRFTGEELKPEHAQRMYEFYISTIVNKNSFDYLNQSFFELIFQRMKDNILYVEASRDDQTIAASMFFYDDHKIYGRYWGSKEYVPNLHFELCYYQGIDFCLEKRLKVFEAGAQGEHKIARGFRPVKIFSAHKIKHEAFKEAIQNFIETEKIHVEKNIKQLSEFLPYK